VKTRDAPAAHIPANYIHCTIAEGAFLYQLIYLAGQKSETFASLYEGDSNEKIKSAIKIQNTARLSCKLTIMIPTV
jgi:hypothetical protein